MMKLKDEFIKLPKLLLYEMYLRLVYDPKDYDRISRKKMLEEIIKEYNQEDYLYHICTRKELDFLKYARNRELSIEDIEKYEWEINSLNDKCIFSRVTFEVFEEQRQNVENALESYKKNDKSGFEDVIIFMISKVRTNAIFLSKALISMITSLYKIDDHGVNDLMGSPLFHFYCGFYDQYFDFSGNEEELVYYRDYYGILDELEEARKQYGIAGTLANDIRDDFDIFYYGFPIRRSKVKKMYDEINKRLDKEVLFRIIDEERVLNKRYDLSILLNEKLSNIINEALDEMPCAAMNGFTPNEYEQQQEETIDLDKEFYHIPQNNAHLCKKAADHYYKLYFAVLDYINQKYKIRPEMKKIYKQEELDVDELDAIDQYLWEHKEIIDDFIKENPNHFTPEELEEVKEFKNAVTSKNFFVVGFDREYTKILSDDGKLYMVKGIRANLDEIMNPRNLPMNISTTLLMFKGHIIFKSYYHSFDLSVGNDIKKAVLKEMKSAIVYYHL